MPTLDLNAPYGVIMGDAPVEDARYTQDGLYFDVSGNQVTSPRIKQGTPATVTELTAAQLAAYTGRTGEVVEVTDLTGRPQYRWDGAAFDAQVTAQTDPLTGGIGNVKAGGMSLRGAVRQRKGKLFRGTYGRQLAGWSGTITTAGTAALVDLPAPLPIPDGATKCLKLTQSAAQSYGQQIVEGADYATVSPKQSMGLWVNNPSGSTLSVRVWFYVGTGTGNSAVMNIAVDPTDQSQNGGWKFLTIGGLSVTSSTYVWGTDVIHSVRIAQWDAGQEGAWPAGAICYFGPVYIGTKARPRFMITFDDGLDDVYHPQSPIVGYPASGRSLRQITEYYGFTGTLYIIPSRVGAAGYMTWTEIREMQDAGWFIGTHSNTHPEYSGRGLTSLGPVGFADVNDPHNSLATNDDTAIYADVMAGVEAARANGVWYPDLAFALPQGQWDSSVRSAIMRSGIKHTRALSPYNTFNTVAVGLPTGGGGNASVPLTMGGWCQQGDAVSTDNGTTTIAHMQAYIDNIIAYGATGANYHHSCGTANAAVLDGALAYLRTKVDAGLIDAVTPFDVCYDDGLL